MSEILLLIAIFCRLTVGFVFTISVIGKAKNLSTFQQTIANFNILPVKLIPFVTISIFCSEFVVAALVWIGSTWLIFGFLFALILLSIFTLGLIVALARKIKSSCNCFGATQKQIDNFDVLRNLVFILCTIAGFKSAALSDTRLLNTLTFDMIFVFPFAVIFVVLCLNVSNLVLLFKLEQK